MLGWCRFLHVIAATATVLGVAGPTHAAAPPARLRLEVVAPCSDAADFSRRVSARSSRLVLARDDGATPVAISITNVDGRVEGAMRFPAAGGTGESVRRVDGATCEEVADALSLVLVITFDSDAHDHPIADEAAAPPAVAQAQARATPAPVPRTELHWFTGVQATMAAVDHLPRGVVVFGELARKRARSELAFRLSLAMTSADVELAAEAARLNWATLNPEVCPLRLRSGAFSAIPCASVAIGVESGVPTRGGQNDRSFTRLWVAPRAVLRGRATLGARLGLEVQGMLETPLTRHRYRFGDAVAFTVPTLFPSIALGVVLELD